MYEIIGHQQLLEKKKNQSEDAVNVYLQWRQQFQDNVHVHAITSRFGHHLHSNDI